jgi:hypothetical protein
MFLLLVGAGRGPLIFRALKAFENFINESSNTDNINK